MSGQANNEFVLRPTVAEIDCDALKHNFELVRSRAGAAKVMAVVKANAYGHGMIGCGKLFERLGADFLAVAYIEEAVALRESGIMAPILVFGGLLTTQIKHYLDYNIDITASSVTKIEAINQVAQALGVRARVHLKVDTGLQRIGIQHQNAARLFEAALSASDCDVIGVYSHFAAVDPDDLSFSKLQLERFNQSLEWIEQRKGAPLLRHISASGGLLALPEANLDMVRPGVMLYGVYPAENFKQLVELRPAMTLKSQIVYFKVVRAGEGVSYGLTWAPKVDTRIVTIPIGYGDGYLRRLSNKSDVLIRGKRYPVVGTVCMDQLMVDLGPDGTAYNGEDVVLLGAQGSERITAEELAEIQATNGYEVIVLISQRVPRIYLNN